MPFQARIVPLVVASALFMEQMDSTIIATSLSDIAADLGTSPIALKLAFTTYLLGMTVVLPISGWLADRYGARFVFRLAIVVFTLSSVACGFAENLAWLIVARAVQGVGGALMVPVGRIILLRSVKKSELLNALAWLSIPALIGPVVGPPIGGFITTVYDWRWIFWMNLPVGVVAYFLASRFLPDIRIEKPSSLDGTGFLLIASGLTLAVLGTTLMGRGLLPGSIIGLMIVVGLLLISAYVRHARRVAHPVLELRLFREPVYRVAVLGGSMFRIAMGAMPFAFPLLLQIGFGYSALETGLLTFVSTLGAVLMKFTVTPIARRFGFRDLLIVNGVLSGLTIGAIALFSAGTAYAVMAGVLLMGGFLRSLQFSSLNALAYANIDPEDMARANTLYIVMQQLSLAAGVAVAAFMLDALLLWHGRQTPVAGDFGLVFVALALITVLSVAPYFKLDQAAGANVSGAIKS